MLRYFNSGIGRLRIIAFFEGLSLILLLFVAMPLKYVIGNPSLVIRLGPVHGAFVLLYLINTFSASVEYRWQFTRTTWKIILACLIPFGTFYIDRKIFRPLYLRKFRKTDGQA
jgi:integral membrane protein